MELTIPGASYRDRHIVPKLKKMKLKVMVEYIKLVRFLAVGGRIEKTKIPHKFSGLHPSLLGLKSFLP